MNYARWNAHTAITQAPKLSSPREFNKGVLENSKQQQSQLIRHQRKMNTDGTLKIKSSWQEIIAEDERQLDLL